MWYNYFKIALRNLFRQKAFSFINIFGLAIGMACSILILFWVQDELSYDRFHAHADQLYRITVSMPDIKAAVSAAPMGAALRAGIPEVKNTARLWRSTNIFSVGERKFEEKRVFFADASFLSLFSFPLQQGDPKTALQRPDGILITKAMAEKYFGQQQALGQLIRLDNRANFVVTGVLVNLPTNSHLQFDFILPISFIGQTNQDLKDNSWGNFNFYTYVQLHENAIISPLSFQKLNQQVNRFLRKHYDKLQINFQLQPVTSIHLHSNLRSDLPGQGSIQYVRIFSVVAVFILAVACINFMNLATARSTRRAKEVGLRKVIGAQRHQLIGQFLGESLIISFLALLLALILVWALLPSFNHLANKDLTINFQDGKLIVRLLGIALITGLLSGSYPAIFLSGFQPVKVLKGAFKMGIGSIFFRHSLVVTQFVVSIVLLIGTAVVYQQLDYLQNKHLGFEKENLVHLPLTGELQEKPQILRFVLKQNPLTSHFTTISDLPTNLTSGSIDVYWEGKAPAWQPTFSEIAVDADFISVFKMKLLGGRNFSKSLQSDTANYLVNETALRLMGMDLTTAIGKSLTFSGVKGTIIGVVQDFNFRPMQQAIEPLVLYYRPQNEIIVVRTPPGSTAATIQALAKIHQQLNPAFPFTYNFLDQDLANLYQSEQRLGRLFNGFALLAIFISCLGLYGLSAFMAEQRTKEIGVRKVLGASVFDIVYLLSKNFTKLLVIAILIAVPLSWWAMHSWLENYAYRVGVSGIVLVAACLTALVIAGLTVSYESIKAAMVNPVKSLKNE
ncbi:ABC transporter permease [Adhaeribacter arboris]|uniref:ABC transporter permease n=1 Tax=Adhaeribacter arboris TaxID=2072846 RepID=A0A2T2YMK7_9BACT|nr:ABC transporter permease [Adhaeribacter arboris]PSR56716.1 ABC transporter permease [Adhaeribacter arboris]